MMINCITLYNNNFSVNDYFYYEIHTLNFTAVILISLPPLLIIVFKKLKEKFLPDNHFVDEPQLSEEDMPARLLDVVKDSFSSDYEYYNYRFSTACVLIAFELLKLHSKI